MRLISAERFRAHVVAVHAPSPGATSATNAVVFTVATLPFVLRRIPELFKNRGATPDFRKNLLPHIATVQRKIAAGLHLPAMADKTKARSAKATAGHGVHAKGLAGHG